MKYSLMGAAAALSAMVIAPAAFATDYIIDGPTVPTGSFVTDFASPTSIQATFKAVYTETTAAFEDNFLFIIGANGVGSGSISTSFSSDINRLTITELLINGTPYALQSTSGGQSTSVNGIPIMFGELNAITVRGFTNGAGAYAGTATFTTAAVVPEPATWAMMIIGFGAVGAAARLSRRSTRVRFG